ncbi:MAG: hypothetical protein Q4D76_01670 [Oscillospiraceae bacterium]|nr:hypothetical protein [Oscillospiraceae bacterium]
MLKTAGDRCPECGRKFFYYDSRQRYYGSPVRTCKKCNSQYLDLRYHEIAVEGIPESELSRKPMIILMIFGALILYRGIYLTGYRQLGMGDYGQWIMPVLFIIMGIVMITVGIIEIIMISTGRKMMKYERLKRESEERMSDRSYAWTLKQEGYNVPEQYL